LREYLLERIYLGFKLRLPITMLMVTSKTIRTGQPTVELIISLVLEEASFRVAFMVSLKNQSLVLSEGKNKANSKRQIQFEVT